MRAAAPKTPKEKSKLTYLPNTPRVVSVKKRVTSLVIVIILLYLTILFAGQFWRLYQLQQTLIQINEEIQSVKSQNEEMQQEIERLHSPAYLEQMAREELGMVRSGEILFYFQEEDNLPE